MFNPGAIVKCIDQGKCYDSHENAIRTHAPQEYSNWEAGKVIIEDKLYKVITSFEEDIYSRKKNIYIVKSVDDGTVYIIGEPGIEKVSKDVDNIFYLLKDIFETYDCICTECYYTKQCNMYKDITGENFCAAISLLCGIALYKDEE